MRIQDFGQSVSYLQEQYNSLDWTQHSIIINNIEEKIVYWPGNLSEDIIITVHKSEDVSEGFHRHDYFYFNYAYKGNYDTLSSDSNHRVTIYENEFYAGQPYAGHALCSHDDSETVIIGLLIRKQTFFRQFLPMISSNSKLFRFFINPSTNKYSDTYIHFKVENNLAARTLLELMVVEYANKSEDTQAMLRPLSLSFLMQISREYALFGKQTDQRGLPDRMLQYISEHLDEVTLGGLSRYFSYHPNYISFLFRREFGCSFSESVLRMRMERAVILLEGTDLSIDEIAPMLGYSNSSNFYKAFRGVYHTSPRNYCKGSKL